MRAHSKRRAKHRRPSFRAHHKRRRPGDVHTISSFCLSNAISEAHYFKLKRDGKGPREACLGDRIVITPEAEADWRREREAETAVKRQQAEARKAATIPATL
jgi:hypothetical protein